MLYSGTDPESYITEYTLVYEESRICRTVMSFKWVSTGVILTLFGMNPKHEPRSNPETSCPRPLWSSP